MITFLFRACLVDRMRLIAWNELYKFYYTFKEKLNYTYIHDCGGRRIRILWDTTRMLMDFTAMVNVLTDANRYEYSCVEDLLQIH